MKLYNLYITAFILGLFTFSSCMDELPVKEEANGVEGLPAIIDLSYRSGAATVIDTKASDITEQDAVQNLIVLVFDTNGDLVGEAQEFTPNATSGKVRLNTTSGERYIFAVANTESTNWGNLTSKIKDVKTINGNDDTALNHIIVEMKEAVSVNDDKILMSGWFEPVTPITGKDKGYCNINTQANGVITSITEGKIELSRIVASVRFNLKSNANITFIPESWTIKNLPKKSSLIEQDSESNETYFIYGPSNSFENPVTDKTNSFSFLMMENRKFASGNIETYDAREKAKSAPEDFVNAPEGSAYLILKGSYSGKANYDQNGVHTNSGKDVTATVTYYVHLGYLGRSNNNFSIERNNKYIYTLTVAGVDKIILEVVKNEDSASGDGDVYMPEHMLDPFDAHYGTTVLTLTKSLIESLKANTSSLADFKNNFQIRTYTPKNDFGTKTQNGELVQDYSWLSFKKNKKGVSSSYATYNDEDGGILDVDGFYKSLYNLKENDYKNGEVYYTCYINEYYYSDLSKSAFVNADDRIVQFNYKRQSASSNPASNSSLTTALYVITQRSIQSIYNLDVEENGWGVEWVQEGSDLEYGKNVSWDQSTDMNDGRKNMISELGFTFADGKSWAEWSTYVNPADNNMKAYGGSDYNKAYAACLNRNRDLNKNGKIDEDEIRWYLPAINQYVGLWIGAPALNPQVRLYTKTSADDDYHYVSNTYVGSKNPRIIWAEEGSSLGNYGGGGDSGGAKKYRCVRNLGNVKTYEPYITKSAVQGYGDSQYRNFNVSKINPKAFRSPIGVNESLTRNHKHTSEENYLANKGFDVRSSATSYCPEGWRVPNQRELTIYTSFVDAVYTTNLGAGTSYAFNTTSLEYYWYEVAVNKSYGNVRKGNNVGNYRCVRDKQ